jgi:hypothetical protein
LLIVEGPVWPCGRYFVNGSGGQRYVAFLRECITRVMDGPIKVSQVDSSIWPNEPLRRRYDEVEAVVARLGIPFNQFCFEEFSVPVEDVPEFLEVASEGVLKTFTYSLRFCSADDGLDVVLCRDVDLHVRAVRQDTRQGILSLAADHGLRMLPGQPLDYRFIDEAAARMNYEHGESDCIINYDTDVSIPVDALGGWP